MSLEALIRLFRSRLREPADPTPFSHGTDSGVDPSWLRAQPPADYQGGAKVYRQCGGREARFVPWSGGYAECVVCGARMYLRVDEPAIRMGEELADVTYAMPPHEQPERR